MAEDTVPTCKRGHLQTPENRRSDRGCRECHLITNRRYGTSEAGRRRIRRYRHSDLGQAAQQRWSATTPAWEVQRRYRLKGKREAIEAKLESLKKEEAEACQTLSALLMQTK